LISTPSARKLRSAVSKLVMVGIDEARHDDAPGGVDHGAAGAEVRADREDLLALDQHVGAGEVADLRVHRHHRAAANDIAPARPAAVLGHIIVRRRGARREEVEAGGDGAGRRRTFEEVAPRTEMVVRPACIAQHAHVGSPPLPSHSA